MSELRTALLGLDSLLDRFKKAPVKAPTKAPSKPLAERFRVKPTDVTRGAYFYLHSVTPAFDATGRPFPDDLPKGSIETTGRVRDGMAEVYFKRGRAWVRIADLAKPLQSKAARTVTAGSEETWAQANDVAALLRILTETKTDKRELKITPKVRKALTEMMTTALDGIDGWYVDLDGTAVPVSVGLTDWVGGKGQAQAIKLVREALKARSSWVHKFSNPKTHQKGSTRTVDYFLVAAILLAGVARGPTAGRADFLIEVLQREAHKAGGSQLTTAFARILKKHIPWTDVAKLRKSRKVKTAEVHSSPTSLPRTGEDARVLDAYMTHENMEHSPLDLVLRQLLGQGPAKLWDSPEYSRPDHRVAVLTAVPRDCEGTACFERSKQGLALVQSFEQELERRCDLTLYTLRGQPLSEVYSAALENGIGSVHRLLRQTGISSWYNQVVDTRGNLIRDMKPVHSLTAKLLGYLVLNGETSEDRGHALRGLIRHMRAHKLVQDHVIGHVIRSTMPWSTVRNMLAHRTELA